MALRLNGSSSGYVELEAPATAGSNTLVLPTGNGTSGQVLQTNGSGALSWGNLGVVNDSQLCKAWVNFNGTGTVAIRAAYNVSSITDNGTGDYTLRFTTAMPDANFAYTCSAGDGDHTTAGRSVSFISSTASSLRVLVEFTSGSNSDESHINVAIFR